MIVLRRRHFWFLVVTAIAALIGLGVFAWVEVSALSESAQIAPDAKFIAERLLFFSFLLSGIVAAVGVGLFAEGLRHNRSAENLMNSRQWLQDGGVELERRLGSIGESFYRINRELIETSGQRGLKIEGMNALLGFLLRNFDEALMVADARGLIVYVSDAFLEEGSLVRSEVIAEQINSLLGDVYYPELVSELGRKPGMIERKSGGRTYQFYNILDRRGEIPYVVVSPAGRSFLFAANQAGESGSAPQRRRRFSWLFPFGSSGRSKNT